MGVFYPTLVSSSLAAIVFLLLVSASKAGPLRHRCHQ